MLIYMNPITLNEINADRSNEQIIKLKTLYMYYHRLMFYYKWKYKKLK